MTFGVDRRRWQPLASTKKGRRSLPCRYSAVGLAAAAPATATARSSTGMAAAAAFHQSVRDSSSSINTSDERHCDDSLLNEASGVVMAMAVGRQTTGGTVRTGIAAAGCSSCGDGAVCCWYVRRQCIVHLLLQCICIHYYSVAPLQAAAFGWTANK
jgi:hypothetical protein